jgi:enoyl-[acyl-carrier protein] reductase I
MAFGLLQGKKGIITGALDEQSIAWQVALQAKAEGAELLLTNAPVSVRLGKVRQLAELTQSEFVAADLIIEEDIVKLYEKAQEKMGKIDFLLHSVGMSMNVRKNKAYTDLNYDFLHKTLDISAISLHRLLQIGLKMDIFNEWGSVAALSYIAAQKFFPKYNDMTEAKALLETIVRHFGYYLGKAKKVRVNSISQSPTPTTAGLGVPGFDKMLTFSEKLSPLGNATAQECAGLVIYLFSDLSRKITMQNIYHDGGFSQTGLSEELLELL